MARALYLAARSRNSCDPNPRVGCVIESRDADGVRIVGEALHQRAGAEHAEILALRAAGELARGATAYVTLEPCCHTGRTGPCTEALIAAGVSRVVVGMTDPNPRVGGGGLDALRAAGIEVAAGLLADEAEQLNRGFVKRMRHGRPFVCSKIAASLDGRVALPHGKQVWITSQESRDDVQQMRARVAAILTGVGTVIADDPRMTVRLEQDDSWQPPMRVIVDSGLRTPVDARILGDEATTVIITGEDAPVERRQALTDAGARIVPVTRADNGVSLAELMAQLAALEINEVMVEAGPKLNGALLCAGLLDELVIYQAPRLLGPDAMPMFDLPTLTGNPGFKLVATRRIGPDWRMRFVPGSV
ncbi:MAG: bifunctional diaminohydroxyphosphoribosylaminopyrimidine deaminase/5-amino-6-(5-phosphoribosylamino)uracil reductase RibD [Gammaproteobacteria bacterium]|nr:bifunctional diaminohydroxyphosphoribosylaminopyrimidine deaminase/5-amino-6-(5-phosphoribosylamino)uracil reductase RibD [Gammaproteobacteria bacterium]